LDRREKKNKIYGLCISLTIVALLLCFVWLFTNPRKTENYRVVCLGDSILGNVRDETSVTSVMEKELGYRVFNGCFGGTCASLSNDSHRRTYYEDSMNLVSIVNAMETGDYSIQYFDLPSNNFKLGYFTGVVDDFSETDFSDTELIFLEHGVNDYSAGRPLDDDENPFNVYTYGGALRYSIEKLKTICPKAQIVIVTPTYCYFMDYFLNWTGDCTTEDYGYGYLEDYANLQIQIASEYNLECIDNYHEIGIDASNADDFTEDGIHLNEAGRALLARRLADFAKKAIN